MKSNGTTRIGVTGHRTLKNELILRQSVRNVLSMIEAIYNRNLRNTDFFFSIISALAEGADRIVAEEVMDRKTLKGLNEKVLEVALPMPVDDYIQDFKTEASKIEFKRFITKAKSVTTLEKTASHEDAYLQAGRYVVNNCDFLIAIWDGENARGSGGTAQIVEYARNLGRHLFLIDSRNGQIMEEKNNANGVE